MEASWPPELVNRLTTSIKSGSLSPWTYKVSLPLKHRASNFGTVHNVYQSKPKLPLMRCSKEQQHDPLKTPTSPTLLKPTNGKMEHIYLDISGKLYNIYTTMKNEQMNFQESQVLSKTLKILKIRKFLPVHPG